MYYVKIIIKIIFLFTFFTNFSMAEKWQGEALERRNQQCSGIEEVKLSCGITGVALATGNLAVSAGAGTACGVSIGVFNEKMISQFDKAKFFRENSEIVNHQDLDNNGINDFSADQNAKDCVALQNIINPATGEKFTLEEISSFQGCKVIVKGNQVQGSTYEVYNPALDCKSTMPGQEHKTAISVKFSYQDQDGNNVSSTEECIYEGECRDVNGEKLCVYEQSSMVCAEMVFCDDPAMDAMFGLGLNYKSISGKVNNGSEADHKSFGNIKSCSELCKYDEGSKSWVFIDENEGKSENISCLEKYKKCKIECPDIETCISNGELNQDCTPGNLDKTICGYDYNKDYLAHCVPNKNISLKSQFEIPTIISPYCSNEAVIKDANNNEISAFTGRAVRCLDQTIRNIMHGSSLVVDDHKRTYAYKCVGGSDELFSSPTECNSGILGRFQAFSQKIVTILLVIAIAIFGIYISYGLINDKKQILKYVISFGIVLYFVNGNAWKDGFYDTLMVSGSDLALIAFNDVDYGVKIKRDGGGGSFTLPSHYSCVTEGNYGPDKINYYLDDEKRYKIWDLLDCRWKTFFGNRGGAQNTASPEILKTASLTWPVILFMFFILILTIPIIILIFVAIAIKAIFMFISAMITISLLVFISPLVIPLVLFNNEKIKGIFKNWLQNLIGYSLVPLVIFLMLAIFFKGIDIAMYGTKENDVFTELSDGSVMVTNSCSDQYIPCLNYKLKDIESYSKINIFGNEIHWYDPTIVQKLMIALLRMLFVFLVMLMVFNYISKSLIASLLQVQVLDDDVITQMKNAASKAFKATKTVTYGSYKAIKHQYKRSQGKGDNNYGTKDIKTKDDI